jgi:hypothetical protein
MSEIKNIFITVKELIAKRSSRSDILPATTSNIVININTDAKNIAKAPQFFLRFTDSYSIQEFFNTLETYPDIRNFETIVSIYEEHVMSFEKRLVDTASISDSVSLEFDAHRLFVDVIAIDDNIYYMSVGKGLSDSLSVSSIFSTHVIKDVTDQFNLQDGMSKNISKSLIDTFDAYDIFDLDFEGESQNFYMNTLNLSDQFNLLVDFNRSTIDEVNTEEVVQKLVHKIATENLSINDVFTVDVNTQLLDNTSINEQIRKTFSKQNIEVTQLEEDFRTLFLKTLVDTSSLSELFTISINSNYIEELNLSDVTSKDIHKALLDTFDIYDLADLQLLGQDSVSTSNSLNMSDLVILLFDSYRSFLEETSLTEVVSKSVSNRFVDTLDTQEVIFKSVSTSSTDMFDIQEVLFKSISKDSTDILGIQEVFSKSILTNPTDIFSIQELFSKSISIDFTDTFAITDDFNALLPAGDFSTEDTMSISDSGSLVIQDYADPAYFLEDYVGDKYTF